MNNSYFIEEISKEEISKNPSPAWSCSNGETLAGMQRQGVARRYSGVKRAVENRKSD